MAVLGYFLTALLCFLNLRLTIGDKIVVQSEKLRNFQGCTEPQQSQIVMAWYEAMSIVTFVRYQLNFNEYAEVDYFGPSENTASAQKTYKVSRMHLNKQIKVCSIILHTLLDLFTSEQCNFILKLIFDQPLLRMLRLKYHSTR